MAFHAAAGKSVAFDAVLRSLPIEVMSILLDNDLGRCEVWADLALFDIDADDDDRDALLLSRAAGLARDLEL